MLFTLTTGEEHITRLYLNLKTAEFLTDVQTMLITVPIIQTVIWTIYHTIEKLAFKKNRLTLIIVLITVLLSVMLFGLFTIQLKNWHF